MSHAIDEVTLMEAASQRDDGDIPRPDGSDPSRSLGGFEPSANLVRRV